MGFHDIQKTGSQLPVASLSPSGGEQLKTLEVIWFKSELPVKGQISDKNYLQHFFNPSYIHKEAFITSQLDC